MRTAEHTRDVAAVQLCIVSTNDKSVNKATEVLNFTGAVGKCLTGCSLYDNSCCQEMFALSARCTKQATMHDLGTTSVLQFGEPFCLTLAMTHAYDGLLAPVGKAASQTVTLSEEVDLMTYGRPVEQAPARDDVECHTCYHLLSHCVTPIY